MHPSPAGGDRRSTFENKPTDVRQDMLRKVLDATSERQRRHKDSLRVKYESAVKKWQGSPWRAETIGCALVGIALAPWLGATNYPPAARQQLIDDIAQAICEDPHAAAQLESFWHDLVEPSS